MKKNNGAALVVMSIIVVLVVILGVGSIAYINMQTKRSKSNSDNATNYQQLNDTKQLAAFENKKAVSYSIDGNERDTFYKNYPILLSSSHEYFDSCLGTSISKMADYYPGIGWETQNGPKYSQTQNLATFSKQTNISSIGGYVLTSVNGVSLTSGSSIPNVTYVSGVTMYTANGTVTTNSALAVPQNVPFTFKLWNPNETYNMYDIVYYYDANPKNNVYNIYRNSVNGSSDIPNPPNSFSFWQVLQPTYNYYGDGMWLPGQEAYSLWKWYGNAESYIKTQPLMFNNNTSLVFTKYIKVPLVKVMGISLGNKYYKYTYTEVVSGLVTKPTIVSSSLVVERVKSGEVPKISLKFQVPTTVEEGMTIGNYDFYSLWGHIQAADTILTRAYSNVGVLSSTDMSSQINLASSAINQAKQLVNGNVSSDLQNLHGELVNLHNASDYSINSINPSHDSAQEQKNKMLLNTIRTLAEEYRVQLLILAQLYNTPDISDSTKSSLNLISVRVNRALDILYTNDRSSMESLSLAYMASTTDSGLSSNKSALLAQAAKLMLINSAINYELNYINSPPIQTSVDKYKSYFNTGTTQNEKSGVLVEDVVTKGTVPLTNLLYTQIGQLPTTVGASSGTLVPVTDTNATVSPISISGGVISIVSSSTMVAGNYISSLNYNGVSILPSLTVKNSQGNVLFVIQPGETKSSAVISGDKVTFSAKLTFTSGELSGTVSVTQVDRNSVRITITSSNPSVTGEATLDMVFSQ